MLVFSCKIKYSSKNNKLWRLHLCRYYVTDHFRLLLKNNGLRHIRFHDLRHSCASLLLSKGVPMKAIQEWLGHSTYSTTANFYTHLEDNYKTDSANVLATCLKVG